MDGNLGEHRSLIMALLKKRSLEAVLPKVSFCLLCHLQFHSNCIFCQLDFFATTEYEKQRPRSLLVVSLLSASHENTQKVLESTRSVVLPLLLVDHVWHVLTTNNHHILAAKLFRLDPAITGTLWDWHWHGRRGGWCSNCSGGHLCSS